MSKPVHGKREVDLTMQKKIQDTVLFMHDNKHQLDTDTGMDLIHSGIAEVATGYEIIKIRIKQIISGHDTAEKKLAKIAKII